MTSESWREPDLKVAGLSIWVHGQERGEDASAHGLDWLMVTAVCQAHGATVQAQGSFMTSSALERFADECLLLDGALAGTASLASHDPNLCVTLEASDSHGHLHARIEVTADYVHQEHRFEFDIDRTYLPEIVRQCRTILVRYPNPHH